MLWLENTNMLHHCACRWRAPWEVRRSGSNLWCNCNEQRSPGSSVTLSSLSLIDRAVSLFSRQPFILKAGACFFCAICFQTGCLVRDTVTLAFTVHEMLLHFLFKDHLKTSADIMSVISLVEIYGIHLNPLTLVPFSPLCCLCSLPLSVFEHLGYIGNGPDSNDKFCMWSIFVVYHICSFLLAQRLGASVCEKQKLRCTHTHILLLSFHSHNVLPSF